MIIKRCKKCGATVEVLQDCHCDNCGIMCCDQPMEEVLPNSVDASKEKHLPTYEIVGNYVVVTVPHVMEEEHFIEYIALYSNNIQAKKFFKPGEVAKAVFPYVRGARLVSSCNKHGLWEVELR